MAILRATTADVDGNVTFEKEAMVLDCQNQARHVAATLHQCLSSRCQEKPNLQHQQDTFLWTLLCTLTQACMLSCAQAE